MSSYIFLLEEASDLNLVGGKALSLSKLINKFNVPKGFVITTKVYDYYIKNNNFPDDFIKELREYLNKLRFPVIARSSATIEDLIYHSFAGQFLSIFPINSLDELLNGIKEIYESVNSEKVKKYLELLDKKVEIKMGVIVQEFINTDYGGVGFSKNIFENKDEVVIEITEGLTENVVSGKGNTNIYYVDKSNFDIKIKRKYFDLDKELIINIAKNIIEIEKYFGFPVDVEFGIRDKIYIFQVRPITPKKRREFEFNVPKDWGYLEGIPTGTGKVYGIARIIKDRKELKNLKPGEILVSKTTYNNWMPDMLKAIGIVNEMGNITSHSAIVAREFGIPTVVGVRGILEIIKDGTPLFVDADIGIVYYPGNKVMKLFDYLSDFILDLIPLDINTLEKVNEVEVIKNPEEIVLFEEYMGNKILYFSNNIDKEIKRKIIEKFNAIEGHSDVHWNYIEWIYGFLIHKGLREWVEKGKKLLDNPEELDKYLKESMKLARKSFYEGYKLYKSGVSDLKDYIKILDLIDLSSKYFGIANTLIPLGYGIRKLRELAMKYGDYRLVLANIEKYKGEEIYKLYKVLEKWKNLSNKYDVWDERSKLWNIVRNRIKKEYGFDVNNYIKNGTGYELDKYLWQNFKIKRGYL